MKILSIIIPSYNMEQYLSQTLSSLIIPSLDDIEIIVVNDGSKDKTMEIASGYAKKYPNSIKVINKINGNYGSCINAALPIATGKYIRTLDADDSFDKDNFNEFVNLLKDVTADIVIDDHVEVDKTGKITAKTTFDFIPEKTTIPIKDYIGQLIQTLSMHSTTYRRAIFQQLDYHQTEGISYTDHEWMFLPFSTCVTMHYIPLTIYKYLVGREGQTVEMSVFLNRIGDSVTSIKSELQILDSVSNIAQREVLTTLLCRRIQHIYSHALIIGNITHKLQLSIFDSWLCNNYPTIATKLDSEQFYGYHLISAWREKGRKPTWRIPNVINLKRIISGIKRRLRR